MPRLLAPVPHAARVLAAATRVAAADLRTIYTPTTWLLGWVGRMAAQTLFFAIIGFVLDDRDALLRLFVGQAVFACASEVMFAVQSTSWERNAGTLPLLVSSPGGVWPVFVGRSLQWIASGVATASIVLFAIGPLLGVRWTFASAATALVGLLVTACASYALSLVLGAWVLRIRAWRNIVANIANGVLMATAGVTVPASFWPAPVEALVGLVPLTHGLAFIRGAIAGTPDWMRLAACAGLGLAWLVAACVLFERLAERGRIDGSITFDD